MKREEFDNKKKQEKNGNDNSLDKNKKNSQMNPKEINNAQIGYQAAITLWTCECDRIWSKFNAFLVASSIILLTAISIIIRTPTPCFLWVFLVAMSFIGMIFCILWLLMAKRSVDYIHYWIGSAREIEEKFLSPVKIVSRGKKFADGEKLEIEPFHMSLTGRLLRAREFLYISIAIFFIAYFVLFASSLCRVIQCYCC